MKLKRIATGLMATAMALTAVATPIGDSLPVLKNSVSVTASAASQEIYTDDYYCEVLSDGTLSVEYDGDATDVTVPSKIKGKKVTVFAGTLGNGEYVEKITLPSTVTKISDFAFSNCKYLEEVTIPDSVKIIGFSAFQGCSSLKTVKLPKNLKIIDGYTFSGCSSLTSVTIPSGVTEIGERAFEDCSALKKITLPNKLLTISSYAFFGCGLKSLTIPKSVKNIGDFYPIGYSDDDKKISGFKLYVYYNTAGLDYAIDQGFVFELKDPKPKPVTDIKVVRAWGNSVDIDCKYNADGFSYQVYDKKLGWQDPWFYEMKPNTTYKIRVCAYYDYNDIGYRIDSDYTYANVTTGVNITSTSTANSVNLKWTKCSNVTGYEIQKGTENKNGDITWTKVTKITNKSTNTYKVTKLSPAKDYMFRIRTYKTSNGKTTYGNWCEYWAVTRVSTVSGLKVKSKTATSVTLQWNKNSTAEGYELQQYKNGKWTKIAGISKNTTTTYTVKNLKAGKSGYKFRIRAYDTRFDNAADSNNNAYTKRYGAWSKTLSANTNPSAVAGFKAKSTAKTSIKLGWNKNTSATGYQLQQYKGGKWVTITTQSKSATVSYTVKSLKKNTTYKFRIRTYKTYGKTKQYSSWSKTLTVKTKK